MERKKDQPKEKYSPRKAVQILKEKPADQQVAEQYFLLTYSQKASLEVSLHRSQKLKTMKT